MQQLFKLARVATGSVKRFSTTTGETAASTPVASDPATSSISWKAITLGITTFGFIGSSMAFFSDRAHKDNETTRRELREAMKALETRMDKQFDEVKATLKEISASLAVKPPRP